MPIEQRTKLLGNIDIKLDFDVCGRIIRSFAPNASCLIAAPPHFFFTIVTLLWQGLLSHFRATQIKHAQSTKSVRATIEDDAESLDK